MTKWEYKIVNFADPFLPEGSGIFENQMDGYGSEGWEAVSAWQLEDVVVAVLLKKPK